MGFGEIFGKAWQDYKNNFKTIFKLTFIFLGIPALLITLLSFIWIFSDSTLYQLTIDSVSLNTRPDLILQSPGIWAYFGVIALFGFVAFFLQLFAQAGLIGTSLQKAKFSYQEIVKMGRSNFWKYICFSIVAGLFLIGLFILLIIPGIIFMVYWTFAVYVLFYEKKGILASLKRSREIVRGRWWKVFGYIILLTLIFLLISIVGGMITFPTERIYNSFILMGRSIPPVVFVLHTLLGVIAKFLISLVTIPLSIFFFKNFYLDMKNSSVKKKKAKA